MLNSPHCIRYDPSAIDWAWILSNVLMTSAITFPLLHAEIIRIEKDNTLKHIYLRTLRKIDTFNHPMYLADENYTPPRWVGLSPLYPTTPIANTTSQCKHLGKKEKMPIEMLTLPII
jgi:hypothetical protein